MIKSVPRPMFHLPESSSKHLPIAPAFLRHLVELSPSHLTRSVHSSTYVSCVVEACSGNRLKASVCGSFKVFEATKQLMPFVFATCAGVAELSAS